MLETDLLLEGIPFAKLNDLDLNIYLSTSFLVSEMKEATPSRNWFCGLLEKPIAKMVHGAV